MQIPKSLHHIISSLSKQGVRAIIVGGAVRDFLLKKSIKDIDIEVYNISSLDALEGMLKPFGKVNQVGKAFGVVKLRVDNFEYDFSLPRVEKKIAKGHRGFSVELDSSLSFKEASSRRDFRINAIGYDILTKEFIDPHDGIKDLEQKTLRHISDKTFIEDPLRVYRAVQFSARFNLKLQQSTFNLCKSMVESGSLDELPKERVYEEFKKLLLKSSRPSIGFNLMLDLGIIKKYYPELYSLTKTPQDKRYHKEGNVWIHTMMVLDEMAKLVKEYSNEEKLELLFGALCHDLGKPLTTKVTKDKISAIGHDIAGIEPTTTFLERLTNQESLIRGVTNLVKYHLRPFIYYKNGAKDSTIRALATKIQIKKLLILAKADSLGRVSIDNNSYKACDWLEAKAKELNVFTKPLEPLIKGRDLIKIGLTPSAKFKEILDKLYRAQLKGQFSSKEEGLEYFKKHQKNFI